MILFSFIKKVKSKKSSRLPLLSHWPRETDKFSDKGNQNAQGWFTPVLCRGSLASWMGQLCRGPFHTCPFSFKLNKNYLKATVSNTYFSHCTDRSFMWKNSYHGPNMVIDTCCLSKNSQVLEGKWLLRKKMYSIHNQMKWGGPKAREYSWLDSFYCPKFSELSFGKYHPIQCLKWRLWHL